MHSLYSIRIISHLISNSQVPVQLRRISRIFSSKNHLKKTCLHFRDAVKIAFNSTNSAHFNEKKLFQHFSHCNSSFTTCRNTLILNDIAYMKIPSDFRNKLLALAFLAFIIIWCHFDFILFFLLFSYFHFIRNIESQKWCCLIHFVVVVAPISRFS